MCAQYSHSRLNTFETCPLKYKFQYIDKIKTDREGIEAFMGSRVHEVLEKLYADLKMSKENTLDQLLAYYNDVWEKNWHDKVEIVKKGYDKAHYHEVGRKAIIDYYNHYQPFDDTKTMGLEDRIYFKLDDEGKHGLIGYIDRIAKHASGTVEIHDYKTSGRLPTQDSVDSDRQLGLYQLALQDRWPDIENFKLIWHYLVFDTEMISTRTEDQLAEMREDVIRVIESIEATEEFEPRESALCPWCDYQEICPLRKHLFKVKTHPETKCQDDDDGVKLVDEYMEIKNRISSAKSELEDVEERVKKYAKDHDVTSICGSDYKVNVKFSEKLKFPTKSDDEGRFNEFRAVLERHGIWSDVSQLNIHALRSELESISCDPKLREDLSKFMKREEQAQIRSAKLDLDK